MQVSPTSEQHFDGWSATSRLMPHQVSAVTKLLPSRVGALFMEMGTGKTRTAFELMRIRQSKISRVIWFCPVTLKATICREILKHTTLSARDIYVFDDKTREDVVPLNCTIYVVGIESMSSSARALYAVMQLIDDRAFVVVDESTFIKGHSAIRTRRITRIAEPARYRLIMTGTPITQGAVDLFGQMRFLSEKILGYKSFYTFANNHLIYSKRHLGQIVGTCNVEWLAERMRPYVYQVTKAECLSLPDKIFDNYYCDLSHEQKAAYHQAKEDFAEDLLSYFDDRDDGLQNGIAIFRLFSRLQAISCGTNDGQPLTHLRLDLLKAVMADVTDTHVVIFCKHVRSIDEIADWLRDAGQAHYVIDGRVSEKVRDGIQQEWVRCGGSLILTQGVGGHGLDLTAAATVVFYSSGFKYSERVQAEDRCHRIGQARPVTYISLWANCGIEDRIQAALHSKGNALAILRKRIDAIKGGGKEAIKRFIMSM